MSSLYVLEYLAGAAPAVQQKYRLALSGNVYVYVYVIVTKGHFLFVYKSLRR